MAQSVHALTASEAQVAIDHLDLLIDSLIQKKTMLKEIKAQASQKATQSQEPKVFFSASGYWLSPKLMDATKNMRRGSIRKIERFVQVDPIFAVRILSKSAIPDDCFRFTDSEDAAKGVLSLYSLI
jgi:hypothetical protein